MRWRHPPFVDHDLFNSWAEHEPTALAHDQLRLITLSLRLLSSVSVVLTCPGSARTVSRGLSGRLAKVWASRIERPDFARMQLLVPEHNELLLLAHNGFVPESAAYRRRVRGDGTPACGFALSRAGLAIGPGVELRDFDAGPEDLSHDRLNRAMLSTPRSRATAASSV